MQHKYFFHLGRNLFVSLAEMVSVYPKVDIKKVLLENIVEGYFDEYEMNDIKFNDIGGIKKVSKHIVSFPSDLNTDILTIELAKIVENHFISTEARKGNIGINTFGGKLPLKSIGMEIKNILKSKNLNLRTVNQASKNLNSVSIIKNKLVSKKGIDLNIIQYENEYIITKTIDCQNGISYSNRDYKRPRRNAKVGMTPPKLVQIMLNIAKLKPNSTVLDPFCGLGTFLQEALLLGFNAYGSDIDQNIIMDSKQNISWFLYKYMRDNTSYDIDQQIIEHDAKEIDNVFNGKQFDAIITEGTLGPPLSYVPQKDKIKEIFSDLSKMYKPFFKNAKKILKPDGKIVITFPCIRCNKDKISFSDTIMPLIENEWEKIDCLDKNLINTISLLQSNSPKLIYERPDQIVLREIMVLRPKV